MNDLFLILLPILSIGLAVLLFANRGSSGAPIYASEEEMAGWDEDRLHLIDRAIDRRLRRRFIPPGRRGKARLEDQRILVAVLITAREAPVEGTVLGHVVSHLDRSGTGLLPGGDDLPDEERAGINDVRWFPGEFDGVLMHDAGIRPGKESGQDLSGLTVRMLEGGYRVGQYVELCELAGADDSLVASLAGLLDAVRGSEVSVIRVRELGQRLACQGRHRGPVKLGMALLGLLPGNPERELLLTLGRHEEFTLYSAIAIATAEPRASKDQVLLSLARSVHGWGRIQAMKWLAGSADQEVQTWMLRDGYRNTVMVEYTACIAATTGRLAEALADPAADDELIDAAADILSALANPGAPGPGMGEYPDAVLAVERFIGHVERSNRRLCHFTAILDLKEFLDRKLHTTEGPTAWAADTCEELASRCTRITRKHGWAALANLGLLSANAKEFHHAERTATALGMDTFPAHWQRLQENPVNGNWSTVLKNIDPAQLTDALDLARNSLPLSELGSGPRDESAGWEHFPAHTSLGAIVSTLAGFPGRGADLVETCLLSPLTRNRNIALDTIEAWTPTTWSRTTHIALRLARTLEPDEGLHERMNKLLA